MLAFQLGRFAQVLSEMLDEATDTVEELLDVVGAEDELFGVLP